MTSKIFRDNALDLARLILLGLALLPSMETSTVVGGKRREPRGTSMHKVQLTQKGYIQFLRWELPVPEITEFTFCLWMESDDLTHPHSIFSYSKNERERLARAWISSHGRNVHLEIGGKQVCSSSTDIRENRWYHVCASWENQHGRYGVWIDGRLHARGDSKETMGHTIPAGGDIVLGQEYTDFDKGLEDGIEGSVLGFNLLLASAFDPKGPNRCRPGTTRNSTQLLTTSTFDFAELPLFARISAKLTQRDTDHEPPAGTRGKSRYAFFPIFPRARGRRDVDHHWALPLPTTTTTTTTTATPIQLADLEKEPLGLQLVKLCYGRCEIGRGSPFVGGPAMLISWTRTPVRVFGGAVLKNVKSDCGNF